MAVLGALGDLVLALSADTAKFQSDLGRGARMAQKFQDEVGRALNRVATTLAAVGGAAGIGALIQGQINAADAALEMSQKVGVSTEFVSQLGVQAKLSGGSLDEVRVALTRLAVNASDTAKGTGEAREAFNALGISVLDANGKMKGTQQLFEEVVEKLAGFKDGINKSAIEVKLLGKSGSELTPLINDFLKTKHEAEALGAILDEKTAKAADELNDEMTRASIAVQALGLNIARTLIPSLQIVAEEMTKSAKAAREFSIIGETAKAVFQAIAIFGANVKFVFETLGMELRKVAALMEGIAKNDPKGARMAWEAIDAGIVKARESLDAFERRMLGLEPKLTGPVRAFQAEVRALDNLLQTKPDAPKLRDLAAEAKEAEERFKNLSAAINAGHADALAWAEAGIEAQKAMEKAFGETLDRDDADMVREVALLEDANEAIFDIEKATGAATKKAEGFNFTFDSALENVIVKGGEARDVVDALITDLSRMVTRELVTKPLGDFVSGALGSAGGISGIIGSMFGGTNFGLSSAFEGMPAFAEGTDFVPRTGLAMVHRGEKIVPAEENARGGRPLVINFNGVRDMDSFRRNEAQISGDLAMAMARARRNT